MSAFLLSVYIVIKTVYIIRVTERRNGPLGLRDDDDDDDDDDMKKWNIIIVQIITTHQTFHQKSLSSQSLGNTDN